jgi:hypothetical protein
MRAALGDIGLQRLAVVYPGGTRFHLAAQVEAVPLDELARPGSLFPETRERG